MGQPRAYDPQKAAKFAAEFFKELETPAPAEPEQQLQLQLPSLKSQAERAMERAGRTPRPLSVPPASEENETCLHTVRAHESSAPASSKESTEEEELTAGELSSLAKMAAEDREILERRRLQKLTLSTKPRT